jgi:hypothetical protein
VSRKKTSQHMVVLSYPVMRRIVNDARPGRRSCAAIEIVGIGR